MATDKLQKKVTCINREITSGTPLTSGFLAMTDEERNADVVIVNFYRYGFANQFVHIKDAQWNENTVSSGSRTITFKVTDSPAGMTMVSVSDNVPVFVRICAITF